MRNPGGDDPRGRETLCEFARVDDSLGHGHLAACARHGQRPLPDRSRAGHRPGRAARHRPASAARAEQCSGRERRRPDPDDVSGLQARRQRRRSKQFRSPVAEDARPATGPHRRRDHERRSCRRDPRHVHHGREPGDVRSGRAPRTRGLGRARNVGGAGYLSHRDGVPGRRDPARLRISGKDGHVHQYRPFGANRAPGARPAGRSAPGSVDHRRNCQAPRPGLALRTSARRIRGNAHRRCPRLPASAGSGSSASMR